MCVRGSVCVFNTLSGDSLLDHVASFWVRGRASDTKQSDGFDSDASRKWLFDVMYEDFKGVQQMLRQPAWKAFGLTVFGLSSPTWIL